MDENKKPARTPDIAALTALVEEIIGYGKELGRRRFYAQPGADPDEFERLWPRILENFFSLRQSHASQQIIEAGVRAQRIRHRFHLEKSH
jgi:hypothetical protein